MSANHPAKPARRMRPVRPNAHLRELMEDVIEIAKRIVNCSVQDCGLCRANAGHMSKDITHALAADVNEIREAPTPSRARRARGRK